MSAPCCALHPRTQFVLGATTFFSCSYFHSIGYYVQRHLARKRTAPMANAKGDCVRGSRPIWLRQVRRGFSPRPTETLRRATQPPYEPPWLAGGRSRATRAHRRCYPAWRARRAPTRCVATSSFPLNLVRPPVARLGGTHLVAVRAITPPYRLLCITPTPLRAVARPLRAHYPRRRTHVRGALAENVLSLLSTVVDRTC